MNWKRVNHTRHSEGVRFSNVSQSFGVTCISVCRLLGGKVNESLVYSCGSAGACTRVLDVANIYTKGGDRCGDFHYVATLREGKGTRSKAHFDFLW